MRTRLALLLVAVACGAAACGGGPRETASQFAVASARRTFAFQFEAQWQHLHPALRRVTTREAYVRCQRQRFGLLVGTKILDVKAVHEFSDPIDAPGVGRISAVAVDLEATLVTPGFGRQHVENRTHVVRVDGTWRALWTEDVVAAYEAGRCPV